MVFKKIREHKEYIQDAASWFQAKWDIPQEEYLKSMNESLLKETSIPQWYIMEKPNKFDPFGQKESAHLIYHTIAPLKVLVMGVNFILPF